MHLFTYYSITGIVCLLARQFVSRKHQTVPYHILLDYHNKIRLRIVWKPLQCKLLALLRVNLVETRLISSIVRQGVLSIVAYSNSLSLGPTTLKLLNAWFGIPDASTCKDIDSFSRRSAADKY